jgi:hypothetical protein
MMAWTFHLAASNKESSMSPNDLSPTDARPGRRRLQAIAGLTMLAALLAQGVTPISPANAETKGSAARPPAPVYRHFSPADLLGSQFDAALARAKAEAAASSGPRAALTADTKASAKATITISPAVHRFLTGTLGIPLGDSDQLTGAAYSHYVVVGAGAPSGIAFGLPAGDAAPVISGSELVYNRSTKTLTVAARSSDGTATSLDIVVPPSGAGVTGTFEMPAVAALGGSVAFRGPISFDAGVPRLAAVAYDTAATALGGGVRIKPDARVAYSSATGFTVAATGELGRGHDELTVSLAGNLGRSEDWSLRATSPARSEVLTVARGLVAEGFSGSVVDEAGSVRFDVTSRTPVTWAPLRDTSQAVSSIEYSDEPGPAGGMLPASLRPGQPWALASGRFAVSAGVAGTLDATGSVGIDLASATARLQATGSGMLALSPGVSLSGIDLDGNLTVGPGGLVGSLQGTGTVRRDGSASAAGVSLATNGTLSAGFGAGTEHSAWSASARSAATPQARRSAAAAGTQAGTKKGTYTVSTQVLAYLSSVLGIPVGTSTTLSGSLAGKTLTVTAGAPANIKPKLPSGAPGLTWGGTTITINTSTNALTVVAAASAAGGETAQLAVTVPKANTSTVTSSSGIKATLTIQGFAVLGGTVVLAGKVGLTAPVPSISLVGTAPVGSSPTAGVSFESGTLTGTTTGALKVAAVVMVGAGPTAISVDVAGSISNLATWSLAVTDPSAPSWQPISGLTVTPDFTGTISAKSGAVSVSLSSGAGGVSWAPGPNATITPSTLTISNAEPASDVTCQGWTAGSLWLGVGGTIGFNILGATALSIPGEACIILGSGIYTATTTPTGSLTPSNWPFSLGQIALVFNGNTNTNTFTVTGTAVVTGVGPSPIDIDVDFSSTGALIAAIGINDLSTLGVHLLTGSGAVWVSTVDVLVFDPSQYPGLPSAAPFHLRIGLSVTFTYAMDPTEQTELSNWGIPVPTQAQAVAALSPDGFTIELDLFFASGDAGVQVFTSNPLDPKNPNAVQAYLNEITIDVTASTDPTVELDGIVTLYVPAITGDSDSTATNLLLVMGGSFAMDSANFSLTLTISGECGGSSCPWSNAFGIAGLTIGTFGATLGVTFEDEIPTPTFGFSLDGVILPQVIAGPIGLQPNATITIDVNFDANAPIVNLQLTGAPGSPALLPLEIVGNPAVQQAIVIDNAGVYFAPVGGNEANGVTVAPGISVNFQASFGGLPVNVYAIVSPITLTVAAQISVPSFNLGPITIGGPGEPAVEFNLSISPQGFVFQFYGGFTSAGFSYMASIDVQAVATFAGASLSLSITGGLPSFIEAGADLNGSVSVDGSGNVSASASGDGYLVVAGQFLGYVSFSWSAGATLGWQSITAAADSVADAFENAYAWSDQTVTYWLNSLEYNADNIASGLQSAFSGISATEIASDLASWVTSSSDTVAAALQSIGCDYDTVAAAVENVWGYAQSTLASVLQYIGASSWDLMDALNNLFTSGWNGYYYFSVTPPDLTTLFMDVQGASYSEGAQVIDYPWDGGTNQMWQIAPLSDGYAEIINANSGQCLTIPGDDGGEGAPIQQWQCNGSPEEAWSLQIIWNNLLGPTAYVVNEYSGYVLDEAGAQWYASNLDDWQNNGGWNQQWTMSPI